MIELSNGVIINVGTINYICPFDKEYYSVVFSDRITYVTKEDYEKIKEYCKLQNDLVNAACKAII